VLNLIALAQPLLTCEREEDVQDASEGQILLYYEVHPRTQAAKMNDLIAIQFFSRSFLQMWRTPIENLSVIWATL
jgi:hypothetical protein